MKNLKFIIPILAIAALALSFALFTNKKGDPQERIKHRVEMMKNHLELSDEQTQKVEAILLKFHPEMMELRKQDLEHSAKREKMKAIHSKISSEIKTVLTPEQINKLEEVEKHRMEYPRHDFHKNGKHFKGDKSKMKAAFEEVKKYKDKNVIPVLKEQRKKLDKKISKEDQVKIEAIRKKIKAIKSEWKSKKENCEGKEKCDTKNGKPKNCSPEDCKKGKTKNSEGKSIIKAELLEAKKLAEKYDGEIEALFLEIKDKKTTWEKDIKNIFEKYKPADAPNHPPHQKHKTERKKEFGKVRFLLMDPNEKTEKDWKKDDEKEIQRNIKVFPNPTTGNATIAYEVKFEGNVSIELLDRDGKILKTFLNKNHKIGEYEESFDLNNFPADVYFYRLTDKMGSETIKIIKN